MYLINKKHHPHHQNKKKTNNNNPNVVTNININTKDSDNNESNNNESNSNNNNNNNNNNNCNNKNNNNSINNENLEYTINSKLLNSAIKSTEKIKSKMINNLKGGNITDKLKTTALNVTGPNNIASSDITVNELIVYLHINLFGDIFNRGYNINKHLNDIFVKRSNKDITKNNYKYALKQRIYLLINEIKNKDIEEQLAIVINNININKKNDKESEDTIIDKDFKKTKTSIETICETAKELIIKMGDKYKQKYSTELEQMKSIDEKYNKDPNELEKLQNSLARKYKYDYMYNFDENEAKIISNLLVFLLLRNKIKNVKYLGELYNYNNIDISSLYNIVSTHTKTLKSLKNYVKNIILDNNPDIKQTTLKYLANNIVFFNAKIYEDTNNLPIEIFLNLENVNILLTDTISNINIKLSEFSSRLGLEKQVDIIKDLDIIVDTLLNSKPEVLSTINKLKKNLKLKNNNKEDNDEMDGGNSDSYDNNEINGGDGDSDDNDNDDDDNNDEDNDDGDDDDGDDDDENIKNYKLTGRSLNRNDKLNILLLYGIKRTNIILLKYKIQWAQINIYVLRVIMEIITQSNYKSTEVDKIKEGFKKRI